MASLKLIPGVNSSSSAGLRWPNLVIAVSWRTESGNCMLASPDSPKSWRHLKSVAFDPKFRKKQTQGMATASSPRSWRFRRT